MSTQRINVRGLKGMRLLRSSNVSPAKGRGQALLDYFASMEREVTKAGGGRAARRTAVVLLLRAIELGREESRRTFVERYRASYEAAARVGARRRRAFDTDRYMRDAIHCTADEVPRVAAALLGAAGVADRRRVYAAWRWLSRTREAAATRKEQR